MTKSEILQAFKDNKISIERAVELITTTNVGMDIPHTAPIRSARIDIIKTIQGEYIAEIYTNNTWFKEIGGLSNIRDLLKSILHSIENDPLEI